MPLNEWTTVCKYILFNSPYERTWTLCMYVVLFTWKICMKCQLKQITFMYFGVEMLNDSSVRRRCAVQKFISSIRCYPMNENDKQQQKNMENETDCRPNSTHLSTTNEAHFLIKHVFEHVSRFLKQKCQLEIVFSFLFYLHFRMQDMGKRRWLSLMYTWGFFLLFFFFAYQWRWSGEWMFG